MKEENKQAIQMRLSHAEASVEISETNKSKLKKRGLGQMEKQYKYVGYLLILLPVIAFWGFYKTYFGDLPGFVEPVHLLIHGHVLALSTWILLLIVQPLLILYKKNKWHRLLGKVAYVLVPLVILTSIGMMFDVFYQFRLDNVPLVDNLRNLIFPFASNTMMILFFTFAMLNIKRKNVPNHTRYMIGMAIILLDPTITRIGLYWFDIPYPSVMAVTYTIIDSLLLCLILFDVWNKLNYKPYLFITACFLFFQAVFFASFYI